MKNSLVSLIFIFLSMAFICCGGGGDDIGGGGDKTGSTVLNVNPANINFSSDGSQQSVTITANCAWKISGDDQWLTVSTHSGSNTAIITLTAERNSSSQDRSCVLFVEGEGLKRSLTVTQKGSNVILEVSLSSINFESEGSQQTLDITANCDWKILGGAQWLTVSPDNGNGNATVTLTAEINTSVESRSCTLSLVGDGQTLNIMVTQSATVVPDEDDNGLPNY